MASSGVTCKAFTEKTTTRAAQKGDPESPNPNLLEKEHQTSSCAGGKPEISFSFLLIAFPFVSMTRTKVCFVLVPLMMKEEGVW